LAQAILDARAAHPGSTLADLYDPDVMPSDLRITHRSLDVAVDRLYRAVPFESDRQRVEHLFGLYENIVTPLTASVGTRSKRRAGVSRVGTEEKGVTPTLPRSGEGPRRGP
jgi:hypothetical protein